MRFCFQNCKIFLRSIMLQLVAVLWKISLHMASAVSCFACAFKCIKNEYSIAGETQVLCKKKYKAHNLKYKAHIFSYVPCIFARFGELDN